MHEDPALGIFLHAIGGLAAASFYIPLKRIKNWGWETGWLVSGVAAWMIVPMLVAVLTVPHLMQVLSSMGTDDFVGTYTFGVLWGIGAVTFGLTMRYLGIALGMAIALGNTAAFGTLIPPIVAGTFTDLFKSTAGLTILSGVFLCLIGIVFCGLAGVRKEKDLGGDTKSGVLEEFDLKKGLVVGVTAGILSACFAFGLSYGSDIAKISMELGTESLWQNSAVLVVILWGGFTTNLLWCGYLNYKNKTLGDYTSTKGKLLPNYLFATLAGVIWYCQFMFYGNGSSFLPEKYKFASWTLHMAFIIFFSNIWGIYLHEWKGVSSRVYVYLGIGLSLVLASTIVIGIGNAIGG